MSHGSTRKETNVSWIRLRLNLPGEAKRRRFAGGGGGWAGGCAGCVA